jgi:tRNA pseudouridine32 synthase/23S rRNA pseudouridine746 synthase
MLPTRLGVGPSTVGLPAGDWPTMLDFLLARFPGVTQATWRGRMQAGDVVDEQGLAIHPDQPYRPHQRLYYYREIEDEPRIPFEERVLFRDDVLLVADKPHFLPVTPTGKYLQESLLVRLKRKLGIETLVPIHRIDRGTAGLVMFCVDPAARAAYQKLFADRGVDKQYEAIVHWPAGSVLPAVRHSRLVPDASFLRTAEVPGEANSTTRFELVERIGDDRARLRLRPVTGRKHQLRVHCNAIGLPMVDDPIYPVLQPAGEDDHARPLRLLAQRLEFTDPVTGAPREFRTTLTLDA